MVGIADGNVEFVRRDDTESRIPKLPPELVTNGGDFQSRDGFGSILDRVDHSRGSQKQNDYDQNRNDGPGQLDWGASIHLGGLTLRSARFVAEFHDGVRQQSGDHEKN